MVAYYLIRQQCNGFTVLFIRKYRTVCICEPVFFKDYAPFHESMEFKAVIKSFLICFKVFGDFNGAETVIFHNPVNFMLCYYTIINAFCCFFTEN